MCGASLTELESDALADGSTVIAAQRQIDAILDGTLAGVLDAGISTARLLPDAQGDLRDSPFFGRRLRLRRTSLPQLLMQSIVMWSNRPGGGGGLRVGWR
jgi:hypothetical protein